MTIIAEQFNGMEWANSALFFPAFFHRISKIFLLHRSMFMKARHLTLIFPGLE